MTTNKDIHKLFRKVVANSLNTRQVNYLGEQIDRRFNLYKILQLNEVVPIPRQTAAQTLLEHFTAEDDIVELFTYMLYHEGERFVDRPLVIWGRNEFISLLIKNKWIYDREIKRFLVDPFYEHEKNFLEKIRIIDMRDEIDVDAIIKGISDISKKMSIKNLDWRVTMRLYDLEPKTGELIRQILSLLLTRQNLQKYITELFVCLKELAINASKANYKLLFEKHMSAPDGITQQNNYVGFLTMFREEIENHGNTRLFELAQREDRFINITFQSSKNSIEIWVTNNKTISPIEKKQILKKMGQAGFDEDGFGVEEYEEGAGLGLTIIMSVLNKYSNDESPLKVIFYPDFIKIGFSLDRVNLEEEKKKDEAEKLQKEKEKQEREEQKAKEAAEAEKTKKNN